MSSTITDIDACTKRLEIAVPHNEVMKEENRAYVRLAGRVKIKGFRKGKVPRRILEQYYGEEVRAEVLNRVISVSYKEILEEKGMHPVGEPSVTDVIMEGDSSDLKFKATVEVIPPFELGDYKGISLELKCPPVTDDAVEEQVVRILKQAATLEDVTRGASSGDYVMFNIEGFEGDTPVPETRRENEALLLGEGQNEKELEEAILGMEVGMEKDFGIDIPKEGPPHLAGKALRFRVKVNAVKEAYPPELNDEFVRSLGGGLSSVDEFRRQVRREVEAHRESSIRQEGSEMLLKELLKMHSFEVPSTLVKSEADARIGEYERQARQKNSEFQISSGQMEHMRESILPQAEEHVRQMILIDRIREQEGISASPEDVDTHIQGLAAHYKMPMGQLKERLNMTGGMVPLIRDINYNKTVNWLYDAAEVNLKNEIGESGGDSQEVPGESDHLA